MADHGPRRPDRADRGAVPTLTVRERDVPRDWDGGEYDRLPTPMTRWGAAVVGWLELRGDERVLDAGCGTGQVTALLRERLPYGHVVAVDGSASMLVRARERLGDDDRVEFIVADLREPLPVHPPVDAILSTATFHWIPDHDSLFRHLAAMIRPDGPAGGSMRRPGQHRLDRCGTPRAGRRATQAFRERGRDPCEARGGGVHGHRNLATGGAHTDRRRRPRVASRDDLPGRPGRSDGGGRSPQVRG